MRTNGDSTRDPLIRAIEKTIATHGMLQPGDPADPIQPRY